jgi:hypothetical protein
MTLCIAWKHEEFISFSSDSRLSIGDDKHTDIGIKVMSIPVRIDNPFPDESALSSMAYEHRIGLCYCGDSFSTHLIKETLQEQLQHLQFLPVKNTLSFATICDLVSKVSTDIARRLKSDLGWNDRSTDFLLGGFCPKEKRVVVNHMQIRDGAEGIQTRYHEVLKNTGEYITLGSGRDKAEEIITKEQTPIDHKLLNVLRRVCIDKGEVTVGGFLQYGRFKDKDFVMYGVHDYRVDDNGLWEFVFTYRGTSLFSKEKYGTDALVLDGYFIAPFHEEINEGLRAKGIIDP